MAPRWADEPYSLVSTHPFSQNSSHAAYYVATQMALAHNGIIRGLNSIYLQAPCIPLSDLTVVQDFMTYCQCWCETMHHHHDSEEEGLFPSLERATGVAGLMAHNVEQHQAFTPGFDEFDAYVKSCSPAYYDGKEIIRLIEGFAKPLVRHLHDEIGTLSALDKYDSKLIQQAYSGFAKAVVAADKSRIAPMIFGTADRNFEDGIHNFPAVPPFVPYIIHYVFGKKYRGAWKFNPCTMWRDRRELGFVDVDKSAP